VGADTARMTFEAEIVRAIGTHQGWKQRLCVAIGSGSSEDAVETVCRDDRCRFGQWLYALDEETKATHRWKWVSATHADFHREAAKVLQLALAGQKKDARRATSGSSRYGGISNRLVSELNEWKRELDRAEQLKFAASQV
jgi:hypothetical protein